MNHDRFQYFRLIGIWVLRGVLAAIFVFAGGLKLAGNERMISMFAGIEFGDGLRLFAGSVEVIGASFLLIPSLSRSGALLLLATMIGAVFTHVLLIGGTFLPALVLGLAALLIALVPPRSNETVHV